MPFSMVNSEYEFDKNKWVVSLINTTGLIEGHAVILVEGLDSDGNVFKGEYDITANSFPEEQTFVQESLGNIMGYITKIRCTPTPEERMNNPKIKINLHRDYAISGFFARSHYVALENALSMISSIENDSKLIDNEIQSAIQEGRSVNWPFKYQKAGSGRWSIFGGNGGESCLTWTEKKIAIAIGYKIYGPTDSSKAITSFHIGCPIS